MANTSIKFKNDYIVYQQQIICKIEENEFNLSHNPSLKTDDSGSLISFATGSYFVPYATTIGLYNDNDELLAIAKLAKPIPISSTTNINFVINLDI